MVRGASKYYFNAGYVVGNGAINCTGNCAGDGAGDDALADDLVDNYGYENGDESYGVNGCGGALDYGLSMASDYAGSTAAAVVWDFLLLIAASILFVCNTPNQKIHAHTNYAWVD